MPKQLLKNIPLFFLAGMFAAVFSLVLSAFIVPFLEDNLLVSVIALVAVEESAKLAMLSWLQKFHRPTGFSLFLWLSLFLGAGFGGFEIILILLGKKSLLASLVGPLPIHIITAGLLGLATELWRKKPARLFCVFLACFALILHLVYNLGTL